MILRRRDLVQGRGAYVAYVAGERHGAALENPRYAHGRGLRYGTPHVTAVTAPHIEFRRVYLLYWAFGFSSSQLVQVSRSGPRQQINVVGRPDNSFRRK